MTYLITGATGFVGQHLISYLIYQQKATNIIGTYRNSNIISNSCYTIFEKVDLNNISALSRIIDRYKPNYIIHLAAESSVGYSWESPIKSFNNNINIFINLLEAIRKSKLTCRILSVGSSEGYGVVEEKHLPLKEDSPLNPISPYAVARVSQELLSKVYIEGYGLDIILTRSFNHFGPGQDIRFVIPSFSKQIIDRKLNQSFEPIKTGNLSIIRDFIDVRDVVKAYVKLIEKGEKGAIYNVCSGKGNTLQEIVDTICDVLSFNVTTITNSKYIRPNDNPVIIGDNSKLRNEIGWNPKYSIRQTLKDVIKSIQKNHNEITV